MLVNLLQSTVIAYPISSAAEATTVSTKHSSVTETRTARMPQMSSTVRLVIQTGASVQPTSSSATIRCVASLGVSAAGVYKFMSS